MKAFQFRLDQALRWRATQVEVEKSKVAAAASVLNGLQSQLEGRKTQLAIESAEVAKGGSGSTLQSWPNWIYRCNRQIAELEQRVRGAEQAFVVSTQSLVEANRNTKLLEKLRSSERAKWEAESTRELEAFASETFLRQVTIRKRTGA